MTTMPRNLSLAAPAAVVCTKPVRAGSERRYEEQHGRAGKLASLLPRRCIPPISGEIGTLLSALASPRTWRTPLVAAEDHVPAATGAPVLLLPGLAVGDYSLVRVRQYLSACGYDVWTSQITCNVGCSEATVARLLGRLDEAADATGRRVAVVGHSRGGLFARVLGHRRPDLVSGVVTLGSPFRDQLAVYPLLWAKLLALGSLGTLGVPGLLRLGCVTSTCCEDFRRDLAAPLDPDVGCLSVFSRRDGIVDWRACVDRRQRNLEVRSTHLGMVIERAVIAEVASAVRAFSAQRARPALRVADGVLRDRIEHLGAAADAFTLLLAKLGQVAVAVDPVPASVGAGARAIFGSRAAIQLAPGRPAPAGDRCIGQDRGDGLSKWPRGPALGGP